MKNLNDYYQHLSENEVAKGINQALINVDDSLSYKDFAIGVAAVLKDEYGSHNFTPFMKVLHAELGMDESLNENEDDDLAREIDNRFGGNPYVRNGNITFRMKGEFPDSEWDKIVNLVKSKGFEVTSNSNYYDIEPGEREWFPRIDFKLK
jgi:hypothetical protein